MNGELLPKVTEYTAMNPHQSALVKFESANTNDRSLACMFKQISICFGRKKGKWTSTQSLLGACLMVHYASSTLNKFDQSCSKGDACEVAT
jgi:hypothetical protein